MKQNSLPDFFRLVRTGNLLIIVITQLFAGYFLNKEFGFKDLFEADLIKLITATVLVAAAGYIINDYMDVKLDMVNKPNRVIIGKTISRRWAMFLHSVFNLLAAFLAYSINVKVLCVIVLVSLLLWLYSQYLKKTYLAGNILVSILSATTILILYFLNENINLLGIIIYSFFAFIVSLIREIAKDIEDIRGDEKFRAKTLPIVIGIRKTKNVMIALQLLLLSVMFVFAGLFGAISATDIEVSFIFIIYSFLFICLPLGYILLKTKAADLKKDFSGLSLYYKAIMILGILSMIFWRL